MKQEEKNLIEKYNELSINKRNPNCRIYSLAVLLNLNGVKVSEDELMLLSMSYWIRACYIKNYHKLNLMVPFAFPDDIEEVVFRNLNIEYRNIGTEIKKFADIKNYIERSTPLLMSFDCNKLTGRQNKKNINIGVLSTSTLLGYEGDYLIFNALGGKDTEFRVLFEQMNESRYTELMPAAAKGDIFVIDSTQNVKAIDEAILEQVQETVSLFFDANCEAILFDKERKIYAYNGYRTYDLLINYLEDLIKQMNSLDEQVANKIFLLVCSVLRKGISSGSGSMSRIEYGVALKRYAENIGCKSLEHAAKMIVKSGKRWRNIARKLYMVRTCYPMSIQYLMDICNEFIHIKEIEIDAMKSIDEDFLKKVKIIERKLNCKI